MSEKIKSNKKNYIFIIEPFDSNYTLAAKDLNFTPVIVKRTKNKDCVISLYVNLEIIVDVTDKIATFDSINQFLTKCVDCKKAGIVAGNDYSVPLAAYISDRMQWKSISYVDALTARYKNLMRDKLKDIAPNAVPKFKYYKNKEILLKDKEILPYAFVIKPTNMVCSLFVKYIKNKKMLVEHLNDLSNINDNFGYEIKEDLLIEEYIQGQEYSAEIFMYDNRIVFSNITEKKKGDLPYFVELQHTVPAKFDEKNKEYEIKTFLEKLLLELGINHGVCHIEFIISNNKIIIVEYGIRQPGDKINDLIEASYGIDLYKATILNSLSLPPLSYITPIKQKKSRIKYFFSSPGLVKQIVGIKKAKKIKGVIEINIDVNIGDKIDNFQNSFNRFGYFICISESNEGLDDICRSVEETIEIILEK